jgi:hypothetical protein
MWLGIWGVLTFITVIIISRKWRIPIAIVFCILIAGYFFIVHDIKDFTFGSNEAQHVPIRNDCEHTITCRDKYMEGRKIVVGKDATYECFPESVINKYRIHNTYEGHFNRVNMRSGDKAHSFIFTRKYNGIKNRCRLSNYNINYRYDENQRIIELVEDNNSKWHYAVDCKLLAEGCPKRKEFKSFNPFEFLHKYNIYK